MNNFEIVTTFSEDLIGDMLEVFHANDWTSRNEHNVKITFAQSQLVMIVKHNDKVVGFGRALTDGIFNGSIYDVVVHPDYQGEGVGKMVMNYLLEEMKEVAWVFLLSMTDKVGFYESCGLRKHKTCMARYLNPQAAAQYLEK